MDDDKKEKVIILDNTNCFVGWIEEKNNSVVLKDNGILGKSQFTFFHQAEELEKYSTYLTQVTTKNGVEKNKRIRLITCSPLTAKPFEPMVSPKMKRQNEQLKEENNFLLSQLIYLKKIINTNSSESAVLNKLNDHFNYLKKTQFFAGGKSKDKK